MRYTKQALDDMYSQSLGAVAPLMEYKLEMPKINSGIFGVPWEMTEKELLEYKSKMDFTVYEL